MAVPDHACCTAQHDINSPVLLYRIWVWSCSLSVLNARKKNKYVPAAPRSLDIQVVQHIPLLSKRNLYTADLPRIWQNHVFCIYLPPATGPKTRHTSGSGDGICSTLLKVICKDLGLANQLPISLNCSNGIIPSAGREERQPCKTRNCSQLSLPCPALGGCLSLTPATRTHLLGKAALETKSCDPGRASGCKHAGWCLPEQARRKWHVWPGREHNWDAFSG